MINEETEKYIEVSFRQQIINWHKKEGEGRLEYKDFKARQCTVEDFGTHSKSQDFFSDWKGYSILCPDIPPEEGLVL